METDDLAEKTSRTVIEVIQPVVISTVLWLVCSFVLAPLLWSSLPYTSKQYKELKWEKKYDWNIRTVAIISALFATFLAFQNIRFYVAAHDIKKVSNAGSFPLEFMMGFFVADFIYLMLLRDHYGMKTVIPYVGHHIVSITGFFMATRYQSLLWYANYRLLSELSTPMINMRFFLQEFGLREHKIYSWNRMITMFLFFVCRIVPIPGFWVATYANIEEIKMCEPVLIMILFVSGIFLDGLNITWFMMIIKVVYAELIKINALAKEKSKVMKQKLIVKTDKVMTSFRENVVHPIKTAQVQMKENLTVKMDNFKDGMERSKGQMIIKMDYLKDGMILRMDNVRRRLSNNTRRE